MTYLYIPTETADKYRRQAEKARLRKARYDAHRPDRSHGNDRTRHNTDAPFVAWDGEGPQDTGYSLFGCSLGHRIKHPNLGTRECLDLILAVESEWPDAIHIAFGFNYDVSMILRELSWRHFAALKEYGRTVWRDYEIEHIPHKWFKVRRGNVTATIFDIRSFFAGSYLAALDEFAVGTIPERTRIHAGKEDRENFLWADIDAIEEYWELELRLMPQLAEKLRYAFRNAGYVPRSWHGPGALARMALRRHNIYAAMAESPVDVRIATQSAFAGGRFELFQAGHVEGKVYNADINSAYPHFATMLPNLARGKWRRCRAFEAGKFAIYHIRYNSVPRSDTPYPLFRRMANGEVVWPYRTEGWYWQPEAELVANDPDAKFIEGFIFDEDDPADRPFAFLAEYYHRRKILKDAQNPAQYTFKLIINAIYGQLAQRTGWNRHARTAPKSHQLEWAGYITSACRAGVYKLAVLCADKLVSIDTDGVSSLAPFGNLDTGNGLGQWKLTEYEDGIFWQSGIYSLKTDEGWVKAKTRGIPKGAYTHEELLGCLSTREPLRLSKKVFVTYGLASQGRRSELNTWKLEPHEFVMGGSGKRVHVERFCHTTCSGSLHKLSLLNMLYGPGGDPTSRRHYLPWLDTTDLDLANKKKLIEDWTLYDENHLDEDDAWLTDTEEWRQTHGA
jgi:DNA polymerase type B, organellar and viral